MRQLFEFARVVGPLNIVSVSAIADISPVRLISPRYASVRLAQRTHGGSRAARYSAGVPSYSIGQAANLLGVSPETVRRWTDGGRLPASRPHDALGAAGGSRVIDGVALAAFAKERAEGLHPVPDSGVATSVRNSFAGIVTGLRVDDVAAQVEIQSGPHRVVSVVTRESVEELGIEVGVTVTARVKSTNVHIDLTVP